MSNFVELTSNDNWFKLHPEKIAGVEYETTSFYFPIMVKGTKEDVLRVTGMLNNGKENEKNVKKWQDFIREPLRAAIPKYLHEKSINEILKIEKDLNDQYNLKAKSKEEKKELLFKIWAISALAKAHDKAKTVNNYPDVDNEDLYNDDERLVKIIQAPEKAKIDKKREQLISKVSAIEKRIAAYEKIKKEAGVDYYNYIILPDYKVLKKLFDKAYDTLKSFNRNNGYGDDNKYKEEEFIRKNQPQTDRTELLKNLISNQENRVKIAERLLAEAKKANEKTKALRDLQTEKSALAESKAYFRVYNLKIAKAKAKAIKIKLEL